VTDNDTKLKVADAAQVRDLGSSTGRTFHVFGPHAVNDSSPAVSIRRIAGSVRRRRRDAEHRDYAAPP
jgi:hypothetical protein